MCCLLHLMAEQKLNKLFIAMRGHGYGNEKSTPIIQYTKKTEPEEQTTLAITSPFRVLVDT